MSAKELSRRQFIAGAGAAALSLPFVDLRGASAAEDRPNFVFILTDDQRYDAMSCAGHPFLRTPNMDRVAKEGVRFTNAFVTISLCSPSRACFLTGQYAHRHGVVNNGNFKGQLPETFPQVLQKAGYETAYVGKWHMGNIDDPRPGFDHWVSFKGQGAYWDPLLNINGQRVQTNGYVTDLLTAQAVEWLKKPKSKPFCLCLAHKAVHATFEPALRHSKLFEDVKIPRPASIRENLEGKPKWVREFQGTALAAKEDRLDNFIRNYNRTVVGIDDSVGRVLSTLESLGVLDNTVVIFTSDNGFFQGEHGLKDKRAMYEESIRIPFLVRYPKLVHPETVNDQMVLNIDICPTILDLAGAQPPNGTQGKSIRPLLKGKTSGWRTDFLYEYFREGGFAVPTNRGVRTRRWKYIEYPDSDNTPELYDLKNDPVEMRNLVNDASHAKTLAALKARLQKLLVETK
ncbi:MAG: sulfatase [Armatimonadota bacterium]|nr:sulfatase [Armatimonadota bacterium]